MLTYLLIIFVIALALAPLTHFMPSKNQRRIARMREYAAVHGLYVEFRDIPGKAQAARGISSATPRDVIYYGKRLPPSRQDKPMIGSWLQSEHGWVSVGKRKPLPDQLMLLSGDILAASVDPLSCGVYWQEAAGEAGEEESVKQIVTVLEHWSEALKT